VTRADYVKLLHNYALSHRKNGKPYLAEALHPDTGSFEGHDAYNHSEHYFHSGFCDLVITGLVGLKADVGDSLTIDPLAPPDWDYFALDDVPFRGHLLTIVWDKNGTRYGLGAGLHVLADGKQLGSSPKMTKLVLKLAAVEIATSKSPVERINYAVNNDGTYFPRLTASFVAPNTSVSKLNDGNYRYCQDPPNRWTSAGSPNPSDWLDLDLGAPRRVDTVKLYFLDDDRQIVAPQSYDLESWDGTAWKTIPQQRRNPESPAGHRPNVVAFPAMEIKRLRVVLTHAANGRTGLTEFEVWGDGQRPIAPPPPPADDLAYNPRHEGYPKASASYSDRFGGTPDKAIDGKVIFLPNPMNRWTSYESPHESDWLEVDFGKEVSTSRVELAIYDDRGGVQPPKSYNVQFWDGKAWQDARQQMRNPAMPTGSQMNEVRFEHVTTTKLRVVFTHTGQARSGVSEIFVWKK
jgi:F5/8 type C domain